MVSSYSKKPHIVCVPYPAQGHINPILQFARLLHSQGIHITYVNTEYNHQRFVRFQGLDSVKGLPDFRFTTIPDGLPPLTESNEPRDIPTLCDATTKHCLGPFRALLRKLGSNDDVPPVTCILFDVIMTFCVTAGEELSIPHVPFWTASAISFMCYFHTKELENRGLVPHKAEYLANEVGDTPIDWIKGAHNLRLKDFPTFIGTSNDKVMYEYLWSGVKKCINSSASAIVFHTFDALEDDVLEAIATLKFSRSNIYTISPMNLLEKQFKTDPTIQPLTIWKEDFECLEWLDNREPYSVVYVNYGSVSHIKSEDLIEFAMGLANSEHPFLWIIRKDVVMGDSAILPEKFLEKTRERGMLTSWCSQEKVLAHHAVGVFVTHCGWNSMLEAISYGVPIICWPFFADQQTNRRYACTKWGNGLEVNHVVKRNEIEGVIKATMEGKCCEKIREKAFQWKAKAKEATDIGGSSYNNFIRLIKEVLN